MPRMYDNGMPRIEIPDFYDQRCKITALLEGRAWYCTIHNVGETHDTLEQAVREVVVHVSCEVLRSTLQALMLDINQGIKELHR